MRSGDSAHHDGAYVDEPKARSGNQSQDHQIVFNVIARLQGVIPEVECFSDMAAETNH
jgi:hypothetical protein